MQFVRHRLSPAMPRSSPDIDANVLRNIQAIVRRPQVVNENPGIAFGAVGKLLGEEWRAMTDAARSSTRTWPTRIRKCTTRRRLSMMPSRTR